ncbi:Ras guanine nucleotide exchange factor bud5 [Blastocladiella emersonii ATCC 22665]|nr:Ras guanine nucleotide exchange factor bud5 [Blastocladiella emersonii ATCC 22665]
MSATIPLAVPEGNVRRLRTLFEEVAQQSHPTAVSASPSTADLKLRKRHSIHGGGGGTSSVMQSASSFVRRSLHLPGSAGARAMGKVVPEHLAGDPPLQLPRTRTSSSVDHAATSRASLASIKHHHRSVATSPSSDDDGGAALEYAMSAPTQLGDAESAPSPPTALPKSSSAHALPKSSSAHALPKSSSAHALAAPPAASLNPKSPLISRLRHLVVRKPVDGALSPLTSESKVVSSSEKTLVDETVSVAEKPLKLRRKKRVVPLPESPRSGSPTGDGESECDDNAGLVAPATSPARAMPPRAKPVPEDEFKPRKTLGRTVLRAMTNLMAGVKKDTSSVWFQYSSSEIAAVMTALDAAEWMVVQCEMRRDLSKSAEALARMSSRFNKVVGVVKADLLGHEEAAGAGAGDEMRSALVQKLIRVGEKLLVYNNYASLQAIATALQFADLDSVALARPDRESLQHIFRLTDHAHNFEVLRSRMDSLVWDLNGRGIPFVVPYLRDAVYVKEVQDLFGADRAVVLTTYMAALSELKVPSPGYLAGTSLLAFQMLA